MCHSCIPFRIRALLPHCFEQRVEKPQGCLEDFPLEMFQGKSDFPERCSPKGQSDYLRKLLRNFFPRQTIGFSTVCQTLGFKIKENVAAGFPEENFEGGFRLSLDSLSCEGSLRNSPEKLPGLAVFET